MKVRKHKTNLPLLCSTLALMGLGLIIIYAIGPMRANVLNSTYGTNYGTNDFFFGQLRSVVLALVAFFRAFKIILTLIPAYFSTASSLSHSNE